MDTVIHFKTQETGIVCSDTEATPDRRDLWQYPVYRNGRSEDGWMRIGEGKQFNLWTDLKPRHSAGFLNAQSMTAVGR